MSQGFPRTRHEMRRAGYTRVDGNTRCGKCNAPVDRWKTRNGKFFDADLFKTTGDGEEAVPHWFTCPKSRRAQGLNATAMQSGSFDQQDRERAVRMLGHRSKARIVVALYDDGAYAYSLGPGMTGSDVQHELNTAANRIRHTLEAQTL